MKANGTLYGFRKKLLTLAFVLPVAVSTPEAKQPSCTPHRAEAMVVPVLIDESESWCGQTPVIPSTSATTYLDGFPGAGS